jgi:hypothetical protein
MIHPHLKVSRYELESKWCLDDICQAHSWLDALDDHLEAQRRKAERDG